MLHLGSRTSPFLTKFTAINALYVVWSNFGVEPKVALIPGHTNKSTFFDVISFTKSAVFKKF